jgi:hypothetical protein
MRTQDNGDLAAAPSRLQHLEESRKGFVSMATIPADPKALLGPVGGMPQVQQTPRPQTQQSAPQAPPHNA